MFGYGKNKGPSLPRQKALEQAYAAFHAHLMKTEAASADEHVLVGPMQGEGWHDWPNMRATVTLVRRHMSLIVTTNGLSDPQIGQKKATANGLGFEFYIDIERPAMVQDTHMPQWAVHTLEQLANMAIEWGDVPTLLDQHGYFHVHLPIEKGLVPAAWQDSEEIAHFIVGIPPGDYLIDSVIEGMPFDPVRFVAVTPITRREAMAIKKNGSDVIHDIVALLQEADYHHRANLDRPSLSELAAR
jgi:hypothetical protein